MIARLVCPSPADVLPWLEAHEEWGPGAHEDGFGVRPSDDVHSTAGFAAWVRRLLDRSLPEGVHDTEYGTVRRYWIAL